MDKTSDQNEENFLIYEISDEDLETCVGMDKEIQSPYGSVPRIIFALAPSCDAREIPPLVHNQGYAVSREQAMRYFKARYVGP
jgi:hypothetical protein